MAYENVGVTDVVERAFRRHYGTVYRYVRRRSRSHEQAEDLTQEVVLSVTPGCCRIGQRVLKSDASCQD